MTINNKCTNKGGSIELIIREIQVRFRELEDQIVNRIKDNEGDDYKVIQDAIQQKYREIKQKEEAIERIEEGFEAGLYTADRARSRKIKIEHELDALHEELAVLEKQSKSAASITDEERLFLIREFWRTMQLNEQEKHEELNKCYKEVISSILWKREDNGPPSIEINFL